MRLDSALWQAACVQVPLQEVVGLWMAPKSLGRCQACPSGAQSAGTRRDSRGFGDKVRHSGLLQNCQKATGSSAVASPAFDEKP